MKLLLLMILTCPLVQAQNLSADEQRALLNEVQSLKERVSKLEKKNTGQGFKSTDYNARTTVGAPLKAGPQEPRLTPEQRKEVMETLEKYKKAQIEQERVLQELENEE